MRCDRSGRQHSLFRLLTGHGSWRWRAKPAAMVRGAAHTILGPTSRRYGRYLTLRVGLINTLSFEIRDRLWHARLSTPRRPASSGEHSLSRRRPSTPKMAAALGGVRISAVPHVSPIRVMAFALPCDDTSAQRHAHAPVFGMLGRWTMMLCGASSARLKRRHDAARVMCDHRAVPRNRFRSVSVAWPLPKYFEIARCECGQFTYGDGAMRESGFIGR